MKSQSVNAFEDPFLIVENLNLSGHTWTREYVILKELDFKAGDTIFLKEIFKRFNVNKDRLLNTGLFNQVEFNLIDWDIDNKKASVKINLVENWFWYPSPIFELGDRSFNDWLYQHLASLRRINLGVRFMHINLSGNSDKLKLNLHGGFTYKYEIDYTFPYLNKEKTLGAYFNIMYVTHKNVAYDTYRNQLRFIHLEDEIALSRFRTSAALKYRPSKNIYHTFILEFNRKRVHDTISNILNPYYFNAYESLIRHFRTDYRFVYTDVDKKIYPLRGKRFMIYARRDGGLFYKDLNYLHLTLAGEKIFRFGDHYSIGARAKFKKVFNFGSEIPYSYQSGMGYFDEVLSGYQLYVVDGLDMAYVKTTQKIKLLKFEYDLKHYMPFRQFKVFPLQLFLAIHGDLGYVHENRFQQDNPFNNQLIYGGALSIDLILYHNYFLSCEFTINHTGELGIFFMGTNTFL